MNGATSTLTTIALVQLAGRRRLWLVAIISLLPIVVASIYLAVGSAEPERWTANVLMSGIVISAVAPLVSLLVATSATGSEMEDGTIVFLLTKPVARWRIAAAKLIAAGVVAVVAVGVTATVSGFLSTWEGGSRQAVVAFVVAAAGGTAAYCTVFTALSVLTSRALVIGLVYAFIWEGVVSSLFDGVKWLSIRRYALGIADTFAGLPPARFDAPLGGAPLLALGAVVAGFAVTVWALQRYQLRGMA